MMEFVSWDDDCSQLNGNEWKNKIHVPNHQSVYILYCIDCSVNICTHICILYMYILYVIIYVYVHGTCIELNYHCP